MDKTPARRNDGAPSLMETPMRSFLLPLLLTAAFATLLAAPAHADAIDGNWCRADGKRMAIKGPAITTPGGHNIEGQYSRHFFSYVIPAGEAGAGNTVSITLLGEYLAHAREGDNAPVQEWRRCSADVS
jgi:hypothetical protein